jgi:hypothetical protein
MNNHKPKLIVGFYGHAGAGKDTTADWFGSIYRQNHPVVISKFAFAKPVKDAAAEMFGVPRWYFDTVEDKEKIDPFWNLSPRQMAQLVGTEMGRDIISQDIWLKRMQVQWNTFVPTVALITDVRFQNEVDWILQQGGWICHITREGANGAVGIANHRSEQTLLFPQSDRTYLLKNDGTLKDLQKEISKFYSLIQSFTKVNQS